MRSRTEEPAPEKQDPVALRRPEYQLRSLPLRFRWEATRRHPSYQLAWTRARAVRLHEPPASETEKLLQIAAVMMLGQIGVVGVPVDPATPFEKLDAEQLDPAWLSGAVHPFTLRNLAALLLAALPKETLGQVAEIMRIAAQTDSDGQPPSKFMAVLEMERLDVPGLDVYPNEPILLSVNPAASAKQIAAALDSLLPQWKSARGLTERRDRSDKYSDYLRVWDLREGWTGGSYDRSAEKKLKEVAAELKLSVATVNNHYRKAFEMIVGHPYSPKAWYSSFGVLKLSRVFNPSAGPVSRRRPLKSPSGRDVPESRLGTVPGSRAEAGILSLTALASSDGGWELLSDIETLVNQGRSDAEIVGELELPGQYFEELAYLRSRMADSAAKPQETVPRRKK